MHHILQLSLTWQFEQSVFAYFLDRVQFSCFLWRFHSNDVDVIVMNEFSLLGKKIPNEFVHVYRNAGRADYLCTCSLFKSKLACLHSRYLFEFISPLIQSLFAGALKESQIFLHRFLQKSLLYINVGVAVLSDEAATVKKNSVFSINNCKHSIVNLSSDNFFTCQNSYCQIKNFHKRKASSLMASGENICLHLEAIRANEEIWINFLQNPQEELRPIREVFISVCLL